MHCNIISTAVQPCLARINVKGIDKSRDYMPRLSYLSLLLIGKSSLHYKRTTTTTLFCTPPCMEEELSAIQSDNVSMDEEALERPTSSEELKALLVDSQRSVLVKKLSEANQQNRFLKRQLQVKDDALLDFKSELAAVELESQALVNLAEEITNYDIPDGSRKINGKYIQSLLLSRLQAVQKRLEEQIKNVNAAQSREVPLVWRGMAESVQVMGSFDGWSQGEDLSPEYSGLYTTFSTTLLLRPGRYQIKFLIDGEWQLSPEFPTVGEGLMQNNLLIVE